MIGVVILQVCRQISYIGSPPRGQRSIRRSSNGGPMEEPPRSFNTKAEERACFSAGSVVRYRLLPIYKPFVFPFGFGRIREAANGSTGAGLLFPSSPPPSVHAGWLPFLLPCTQLVAHSERME